MKTLRELLQSLSKYQIAELSTGKARAYKVTTPHGPSQYVISNSKGNAALEICEVENCTQKQLQVALFENLLKQEQEND